MHQAAVSKVKNDPSSSSIFMYINKYYVEAKNSLFLVLLYATLLDQVLSNNTDLPLVRMLCNIQDNVKQK